MSTNKLPKNAEVFYCESCNFTCSKKSNFSSHLMTSKHKKATESTDNNAKNAEAHCCENCQKKYKDRTGLWRHKKKCIQTPENLKEQDQVPDLNQSMIVEIIKQNQSIMMENKEFKELIIEQNKQLLVLAKKPSNITNNTMNNKI